MSDLEEISKICEEFDRLIVRSFSGVTVKVDDELSGNQHYLCVSREMFEKIAKYKEENL